MTIIDYAALGEAQEHYRSMGYQPIEVPWRVTVDTINITKPPHVTHDDYVIAGTNKALLASGEQGFLYLMLKGFLPPGKYQTVTPCFRNEAHDRYHSKQFMKLELIHLLNYPSQHDVLQVMQDAKAVMRKLVARCGAEHTNVIKSMSVTTNDPTQLPDTTAYDVYLAIGDKQIELGSYGARRTTFASWVYGTGLAEPRFSKAFSELERFT